MRFSRDNNDDFFFIKIVLLSVEPSLSGMIDEEFILKDENLHKF
jgi:hypothetical protein